MSNGVNFPLFGLGTWLAKDANQLRGGLEAAIDAGYRYIDTAQLYGNEHIIGEFLEEKYKAGTVKRSDIFITSKILLRQMIQRGISTIPKSVTPARIQENINIFDFELTPEEMAKFDEVKPHVRIFLMTYALKHPWYPFEKVEDENKVKDIL
uniref:NADP-dependent oxidoreductase domain-containing protein n=1 Tax=Acrobeloides nanus TaxID=290746 RepID=A0A914E2L6_9BILA